MASMAEAKDFADGGIELIRTKPYIDVDEWRDEPTRHRYVHGGFEDDETRFAMYFPPEDAYRGRFFQPVMAVSGAENSASEAMSHSFSYAFALEAGAYMVESNLGRRSMFPGDDPSVPGYRASAAVAQFSRKLAAEMYGEHRPYGYLYGGSGGAFKTITGMEHTLGIWDGGVPFVHGSPVSMPNAFTVQAHAMRILWDKFPQIVDAVEPGGSGDMYAGLTIEEREALAEVTRMGFPPRSWFDFERIAFGYTGVFTVLVDNIVERDPTYFEDFWTEPGYLGANPTESLRRARIRYDTKIDGLVMPQEARELGIALPMPTAQVGSGVEFPAALRIEDLPEGNLQGASIIIRSGGAKDHVLYIVGVVKQLIMVGFGAGHFEAMAALRAGDEITIDNAVYLATQTYHRHQSPPREFYVWDQYRDFAGKPIYPQRPVQLGESYIDTAGAPRQDGEFDGKMIVVQALMDEAAYPWKADWYRERVRKAQGAGFDGKYRLYYIDHSLHTPPVSGRRGRRPAVNTRAINYAGALQCALLALSDWVEKGIAPPASTNYEVVDGQVIVPASAAERLGIQPVVTLEANGGERTEVKVGETVRFRAFAEVPPGGGKIVTAEWDFEAGGDFPVREDLDPARERITLEASHTFDVPGTYFPAIRVSAHPDGDVSVPFARVPNLGRARVVVSD